MVDKVKFLLADINQARQDMLSKARHLTPEQGAFKPAPDQWSVTEVIEHLVLAEHSGINKMWVALEASRKGEPVWTDPNPQKHASIEDIIADTWKDREVAPPIATPSWGGPLAYWLAYFESCQQVVEAVGREIQEAELDEVVFPHYLSGPLTLRQRLEFIRFHIERHVPQVQNIQRHPDFGVAAN